MDVVHTFEYRKVPMKGFISVTSTSLNDHFSYRFILSNFYILSVRTFQYVFWANHYYSWYPNNKWRLSGAEVATYKIH